MSRLPRTTSSAYSLSRLMRRATRRANMELKSSAAARAAAESPPKVRSRRFTSAAALDRESPSRAVPKRRPEMTTGTAKS